MRILPPLAMLLAMLPAVTAAAAELPGFPHSFPINPSNYTDAEIYAAIAMCQKFHVDSRQFSADDRKGLAMACATLKKR